MLSGHPVCGFVGISGRNEPRVLLLPAATAAKLDLVYGTGVSPREPTPKSTRRTASSRILRGAARLGFVEGQNLVVDSQGYNLRIEQLPEHAVELVKAQVDVIVCGGDVATHAAQRAKATIPILAVTDDMVGQGLVRSLVQPGGNTTGVSILAAELDGKRQEILMEGVPGIRRIAALYDSNIIAPRRLQALQDAARARGIEFSFHGGRHARTDRPGH